MNRRDLEHLIRVSSQLSDEYELVVIGSQAILGTDPNPPAELTVSMEADIYPLNNPDAAEKIEGVIGEGSQFHATYGYYAQAVGPDTARLPGGWKDRLLRVPETAREGGVAYCIGVVDLFLSKAAAGREKDRGFCIALLQYGYLKVEEALELVAAMPPEIDQRTLRARIRRWAGG
jgi:hypothetical protein